MNLFPDTSQYRQWKITIFLSINLMRIEFFYFIWINEFYYWINRTANRTNINTCVLSTIEHFICSLFFFVFLKYIKIRFVCETIEDSFFIRLNIVFFLYWVHEIKSGACDDKTHNFMSSSLWGQCEKNQVEIAHNSQKIKIIINKLDTGHNTD